MGSGLIGQEAWLQGRSAQLAAGLCAPPCASLQSREEVPEGTDARPDIAARLRASCPTPHNPLDS